MAATGVAVRRARTEPVPTPPTRQQRLSAYQLTDRLTGWLVTGGLGVVALVIRVWGIGFPPGKIFDEVYYPDNAVQMLRQGYASNPGHLFVVHPPLGKWCMAVGIAIFGNNSTGWRVGSAVAGTVAVVILVRVVRRMTGSTLLGGIAGLLLTLEGLSFVQSRIAILDIYLQPFILGGFACLLLDRDAVRARLATLVRAGRITAGGRLPAIGPRPWRLLGGILLGASCGVKWSGVYFLAGFAILSVVWDRAALHSAGVRRPTGVTVRRVLPAALVSLAVLPLLAYVATWTGWLLGDNGYDRHWADTHPSHSFGFVPGALRGLWQYHVEMFRFAESLTSWHPYRSQPWAWLVDGRPVNYYYPGHVTGCGAKDCVRQIVSLGVPASWWAFLPAIGWMLWLVVARRDWRAVAVLVAFAAGWGTWLFNTARTMFFFYMTPLVPFLVLGVTLMLGDVLAIGRPGVSRLRRTVGLVVVCGYLALVVGDFAWMWPVLTGQSLTQAGWNARMWFGSWI